jgi:catechol 2,3-dioxygenase-like lactoylglutathione lyase family enzyme
MHLDHLALATPDPNAALASLVGDLGATVLGGGDAIGFRWVQVFLGHDQSSDSGMKLELITPWEPENNDFLQRFIARHGEGPHHLTFKVSNLAAELSRLHDLGFEPVGVNLSNPEWREAFLLPRQSHGTVVQLAESSIDPKFAIDEYRRAQSSGPVGTPFWWQARQVTAPKSCLARIVLRSADPQATTDFFCSVLGGKVEGSDLVWPGGGRIKIVTAGSETPGVSHLELQNPQTHELTRKQIIAGIAFE